MASSHILTAAEARQLLDYNPETGILTWRHLDRSQCASEMAWRAKSRVFGSVAGSIAVNGYRSIAIGAKRYYAHRLAWLIMTGGWPTDDIDHRNGDRDDNRWSNIRAASRSQNHQNRVGREDTGASWHERMGRWRAVITLDKKQKHVGYFDTEEEAVAAYREAKALYHPFQPKVRVRAG